MSRDSVYLLDILKAAKLALNYLGGKTKEEFFQDTQCQDAVIRRLEIIGEAAGRISATTTTKFPDLPWKKIVSMRNIMIHEYDDVDLTIVCGRWKTGSDLFIAIPSHTPQYLMHLFNFTCPHVKKQV